MVVGEERMLCENERMKSEGKERAFFFPEQPNNDGFV